jgi:Ion channel
MLEQLLVGTCLISATVIIHAQGSLSAIPFLRRATEMVAGSRRHAFRVGYTVVVVLWLFALHTLEIWLWAAFYWLFTELPDFETALYFSISSYTTLGYGDIVLGPEWRILAALEAANGILLFGWSTTFLLTVVRRVWEAEAG